MVSANQGNKREGHDRGYMGWYGCCKESVALLGVSGFGVKAGFSCTDYSLRTWLAKELTLI